MIPEAEWLADNEILPFFVVVEVIFVVDRITVLKDRESRRVHALYFQFSVAETARHLVPYFIKRIKFYVFPAFGAFSVIPFCHVLPLASVSFQVILIFLGINIDIDDVFLAILFNIIYFYVISFFDLVNRVDVVEFRVR